MAKPKAILFDNDGTLVDTYDLILESMRVALRQELGHELPEAQIMAKVGQPLVVQVADFTPDAELQKRIVDTYREYNAQIHDKVIRLFDGLGSALPSLCERGYPLAVVTSKLSNIAAHGLEVVGVSQCFEFVVGAEHTHDHKPDPEPVVYGCEKLGLDPVDCVYVGDSPFDMHAGNAAGCTTIAVTWGMFNEERLREENPDYVVHTADELLAVIAGM